ncbi:hypothetical protein G6F22_006440 [Rhizopus arrhizus]|nr:hypothetical protein G6F22_006440 [Rhizopus arrhizus]KAG1411240.1 hypothetical protein G6F58_008663 [Rhizopus delemar]
MELTRHYIVHKLLLNVLDTDDYKVWLLFLWSFDGSAAEGLELKLLQTARFILTDFASKCNRDPAFVPKGERTFWIDRIVPLFQIFGDQTSYLGFEWCEAEPNDYKTYTIDSLTWMRTSKRSVDGLGYNKSKIDQIVMEGSSGLQNEVGGTGKYEHQFFNSDASGNDEANPGKYVHIQRRHASIPITFEDRYEWIVLFELLSFLLILLEKQDKVKEIMIKERNRLVTVDPEKTVGKLLSYDE